MDEYLTLSESDDPRCTICGSPARIVITPGAPEATAVNYREAGITAASGAEKRKLGQNENLTVLEPGTPAHKRQIDKGRARLDANAQTRGYRHWDDMKRDQRRKRELG
tara:strand:+ start:773 stop:1096 length:324 start_codon:yes stop_codon:yes gene_type:complete